MKIRKLALFALLLTSFFPHVSSATGDSPGARVETKTKVLTYGALNVLNKGKEIAESVVETKGIIDWVHSWFETPTTQIDIDQLDPDHSYTGHRRMSDSEPENKKAQIELGNKKVDESIYNQVKQQLDQSSQSRNQYECCPPPVCCPTEKNQDEKKDKKKRESSSRALDEWVQLAHLLASVCPIVTQFAWLTVTGWTRLICDVVPATGSLVYKTASYAGSCLYNLIPGRSSVDDGTGKQSLIKNSNLWTEETIDFSKKSRNQDMVIE